MTIPNTPKIRQLIKERGYTLQEIADKIGLKLTSLRNGLSTPTMLSSRAVESIAEVLGVDTASLYLSDYDEAQIAVMDVEFGKGVTSCPYCHASLEMNLTLKSLEKKP